MNGNHSGSGVRPFLVSVAVGLIVLTFAASACGSGRGGDTGMFDAGVLTPIGKDSYPIVAQGSRIVASSPKTNSSGNLRIAFWRKGEKAVTDQQSCLDWLTPDGRAQPGMALRIVPEGEQSHAKAIVLTQNLWGGALGTFYVLGMEEGVASSDEQIGLFRVSDVVAKTPTTFRKGPWHVCARAVGSDYRIKVWVGTDPEPSWSATHGVWRLKLPTAWVYAGLPGAYVGHILPGEKMAFANLVTSDVSAGS